MVEALGVIPGDFMGSVFSMMTPLRSLTKYNVDLLDVVDDEAKLMNFLRMEKWLADSKLLDPEGPDEMFEPFSRRRGLLFHLRHRHRHHP